MKKKTTLRHIIIKMFKVRIKRKNLKAAREINCVMYSRTRTRMVANFKREDNGAMSFKLLKEKKLST